MNRYIVKRHGSNAANQSRQLVRVLGTIAAENADMARRLAAGRWSVYNNQHIEVIDLAGRTRKADREAAEDADACRAALEAGDAEAWDALIAAGEGL